MQHVDVDLGFERQADALVMIGKKEVRVVLSLMTKPQGSCDGCCCTACDVVYIIQQYVMYYMQ